MNYAALFRAINTATTRLQGRAAAALNQALVTHPQIRGTLSPELAPPPESALLLRHLNRGKSESAPGRAL